MCRKDTLKLLLGAIIEVQKTFFLFHPDTHVTKLENFDAKNWGRKRGWAVLLLACAQLFGQKNKKKSRM